MTLTNTLTAAFQQATSSAFGPEHANTDPILKPSSNPKFGDLQANLAMALGKKIGQPPRKAAEQILEQLDAPWADKLDIAGPGFINITLKPDFLADQLAEQRTDPRLGITVLPADPVVVDYSAPNVAKEMHVGHLRSTVIGDALARMLDFAGRQTIRQNHLGDWGTQFGMLIENLLDHESQAAQSSPNAGGEVAELDQFYKQAKARFDAEPDFAERSRQRVVALQSGDPDTLARWQQLIDLSKSYFAAVYSRMNVLLTEDDIRPESFYNDQLAHTLERFDQAGHLAESQGATVIYPEGFTDRDDNPLPMIVRKSDGGYLYATTDLAAALYRIEQLGITQAIYVTDSRQAPHFAMVFQALKQAGFLPDHVSLDHVAFGTVLGPDRKPFKSRSGDTIKLINLIDEAQQRAHDAVATKNPDLTEDQRQHIAEVVGIAALKYADLSNDRIKDYVFDWDRMLALEGNTAPYLIYSYVRIQSIFRKADLDPAAVTNAPFQLTEPDEKNLALHLLRFPDTFDGALKALEPHRLCTYAYELAANFHRFFEHCPVLKAHDEPTKAARLALCAHTANTLKITLNLLGIQTVEQM
ncbi:arginine--tRNA ligase [Mucisphaera sp.]|uniref:arginine--tRNA ligase n=1 Tax=Mucisphaera sp. TaxID=2913024 RepID=UPI003D0F2F66